LNKCIGKFIFLWAIFFFTGASQADCSALDQLLSISGGGLPDVPMPGEPAPDDSQHYEQQPGDQRQSYDYSRPELTYEEQQRRKKQREERRMARERARENARREAKYRDEREKQERIEKAWPKGLPRKRSWNDNARSRNVLNRMIEVYDRIKPGEEAIALKEISSGIKGLRLKKALSYEEKQVLEKLEAKAREIWFKAIKTTNGDKNRHQLVVPLGWQNDLSYSQSSHLSSGDLKTLQDYKDEKCASTLDPIARFFQEKTGQLVELEAEEFAGKLSDRANVFAEVLAVGKVTVQLAGKDYQAAAGEAVNYMIGKIPYPQAQLAVEGGKIYANAGFRLLNDFMSKAMAATGGYFDQEQFWADLKEDMSFAQKSFLKWAGDPEND